MKSVKSAKSVSSRSAAQPIRKPKGKLGILIVGLNGAVSTTFLAGVMAARKGIAKPIGSLTQMGTIRLGKRTDHRSPLIRKFIDLAKLEDLRSEEPTPE